MKRGIEKPQNKSSDSTSRYKPKRTASWDSIRYAHTNTQRSIICNSQKMETTYICNDR